MKNILNLFIALVLAINLPAKTIEKTYFFNDFQTQQTGIYQMIIAPASFQTAINGQPLLPWYSSKLLLPAGEEIASVEILKSDKIQMPGSYLLMPKQYAQPISKGGSGEFVKNEEIYQSGEVYPNNTDQYFQTSFWGGHAIGIVNYTPFEYIPNIGELSFYRQITVVVQTKPSEKAKNALSLMSRTSSDEIVKFVENPEQIREYKYPSLKNNNYDYLIITPEQFVEDFDTLVAHYLLRGMKTVVKSKEEILAEMSGQDAQEKIRNYIIQEFTDKGVSYVMLGGDVEHIPYRGFYCSVQSSSVYEDTNIPSDLYYSALDGSWNEDGDSKWGEIGEDDLLPEVAVARFSFSNASELSNMLHKTIAYQSNPVEGDLAHPLFAGEHLYDYPNTEGSDFLELLIGYRDDNGYETTGIPESNTITKLYDENSYWSASDLMDEINAGKNFVHHSGHANESTVMKFYISDINNNNFSGANGIDHQYTNVYTHGCICGSFDANDCIAEYMVKINNFAAAFVGNSRYGWFNEGQTEGPSAHIHREFVDALYTDSLHRIGMAHMESKYATSPWVNAPGQWEEGALRWCFYDCNVLGDPAMSVWTAEPWDIAVNYPTAVTIGQNQFEINISSSGSPVAGLDATLVMDGEIYAVGSSDLSGNVNMVLDPVFTNVGMATLWVSGFNCVPHAYEIQVIPSEGAYVIMEDCTVADPAGNNNGAIDYGETVALNISLQNVGQDLAPSVQVLLTTTSEYVSIIDGEVSAGDISGNGNLELEGAFSISVSSSVPDLTPLNFEIQLQSGDDEWVSSFQITAFAPQLELISFTVNDEAGNNNGRLDPGETVAFIINMANNGHSLSPIINAQLSTETDFIDIANPTQTQNALNMDEEASLNFELLVSESCLPGDVAHLMMNLAGGAYTDFMSYYLPVGLVVEDWETGDFSMFDWNTGGFNGWDLTSEEAYDGMYSAESGNIGDNQQSEMMLDIEVIADDSISFYFKVSSEESFDYLRFNIDENEQQKWSGEIGWTRAVFPILVGSHTLKWSYTKDVAVASGMDKAFVDYIVFPAMGVISGLPQPMAFEKIQLYPNPATDEVHLVFENTMSQQISCQIIDQKGMILEQNTISFEEGIQQINLSFKNYAAGVYTIVLVGDQQLSKIKMVKL